MPSSTRPVARPTSRRARHLALACTRPCGGSARSRPSDDMSVASLRNCDPSSGEVRACRAGGLRLVARPAGTRRAGRVPRARQLPLKHGVAGFLSSGGHSVFESRLNAVRGAIDDSCVNTLVITWDGTGVLAVVRSAASVIRNDGHHDRQVSGCCNAVSAGRPIANHRWRFPGSDSVVGGGGVSMRHGR